ncbi:MAG: DUF2520 domain-containing protein [Chloroflexi bacterium]|nr:DUF2520 domain-containing protein [Chloroflexota bacterium]
MSRPTIGFIGAGTVGTALAVGLSRAGYPVIAVASRRPASAQRLAERVAGCRPVPAEEVADRADLVFVTTPDDAIAGVAEKMPWRAGKAAVHCSGATPLAALRAARERGTLTGAFHPVQTFSGVEEALSSLPGSTVALEAEEPLLSRLKEMAGALGCSWVVLSEEQWALHHVAGVLASNYLITLVAEAASLWERLGVDRERAMAILRPLVQGTVDNIGRMGLPEALTGPIARGDVSTVERHLAALSESAPQLLELYREIGARTVSLALEKGRITDKAAQVLRSLLERKITQEVG